MFSLRNMERKGVFEGFLTRNCHTPIWEQMQIAIAGPMVTPPQKLISIIPMAKY